MSSISTVPAAAIRSLAEETSFATQTVATQSGVAPGIADASADAPPVTSEILAQLGLLGLRSPAGTGDISVLLAQTLFGTDQTRSEADRQRLSVAANAALAFSGQYNTAALEGEITTKSTRRAAATTELAAAVTVRDARKSAADEAGTRLSGKTAELASARAELANAKTPDEKKAAQAKVDGLAGEVATLTTKKAEADASYGTAVAACTTLDNEIKAIDVAVATLRGQIVQINAALVTVSLLLAAQQTNDGRADNTKSRAIDLDVEALFEAIGDLSLKGTRSANPLLRDGAPDEAEKAPPRPVTVATALQAALADLLRELNGFDPLLLARPPEQTGLDRLRLRV